MGQRMLWSAEYMEGAVKRRLVVGQVKRTVEKCEVCQTVAELSKAIMKNNKNYFFQIIDLCSVCSQNSKIDFLNKLTAG